MDRLMTYPGAIPLETDLLNSNKFTMVAMAKLTAAVLGTSTILNGLACTPTSPASMQVQIGPGEIYCMQNIDNTPYSSLPADTHSIMKQGILMDPVLLSCPAPTTSGQSINYLVQVSYLDQDVSPVVLPYYNASNPSQAWSGPTNSGSAQNTVRRGLCNVAIKAGIPAATGSQTTPAPDAGFVGAYVVTVGYGQVGIIGDTIGVYQETSFIPATLPQIVQGTGKVVSDMSALRAISKAVNGSAFVIGFNTELDGGGGQYYYDSTDTSSGCYFSGSILGTMLVVNTPINGSLAVGQLVTGRGVAAGTYILSGSGTVWTVSVSQTAVQTTMTADFGGNVIVAADGGRWKLLFSSVIKAEIFGIIGDGVTDNTNAMTAAALALASTYKTLKFGPLVYCHSGNITFNSMSVHGDGDGTEIRGTNQNTCALYFVGDRVVAKDFKVTCPNSTSRIGTYSSNGTTWSGATNFRMENVWADKVCAGNLFDNCEYGEIVHPKATNTWADSLHFTNGCSHIEVLNPVALNCGDDSVAVVSYVSQGVVCNNITVFGGKSVNSAARGYAIVGGQNITFIAPYVESCQAAGAYINSEPSYNTYGNQDCKVIGGTFLNTNLKAGISQGALFIAGRPGTSALTGGGAFRLDSYGCEFIANTVDGTGIGLRGGICLDPGSTSCRAIGNRINNIRQTGGGLRPNGVEIGGADAVVENNIAINVGGVLINVNTTATGYIVDRNNRGDNVCLDSPPANCCRFLQGALGVASYSMEMGELLDRGNSSVFDYINQLPAGVLQFVSLKRNGVIVSSPSPTIPYSSGVYTLTVSNGNQDLGYNFSMLATDVLNVVVNPKQMAMVEWFFMKSTDNSIWKYLKEIWYLAFDGFEAPSGASSVDYTAITSGTNHYQRNSSRANITGSTTGGGATIGAFSMNYNSGTGLVTITYTPNTAQGIKLKIGTDYKFS